MARGWEVMILWKYGSKDWIQIKYIKYSNPFEVAEYVVTNYIQDDLAFDWWVSKVPSHRNIIISKVKSKYWRTAHKFRIQLTKTVEEALRIDKEAGNYYWEKALNKEMSKVKFLWQRVDGVTPDQAMSGLVKKLIEHQEINCHIIFYVHQEFQQKSSFVTSGHKA